jgi:eukaryotic-like serine/threonine-protein kinase
MALSPDELLVDLLAEFDEALAHRETPQPGATASWDEATRARHRRNQACVEFLADLRAALTLSQAKAPGANTPGAKSPGTDTPGNTDAATALAAPLPDRLGRFKIRRQLGCGGFGIVYLADDPQLGRQVAIKVPRAGALLAPELTQRFMREALAAGKLRHPNLVRVLDVVEDGPACYIVADYCHGPTLARWLRQNRVCPPRLAARWLADLASAVHYVHGQGILHRDIKPGNILLQTDDAQWQDHANESSSDSRFDAQAAIPKLTDFGLAKVIALSEGLTRTGGVMGTTLYMAPEQAEGRAVEVGPATDIYALGAVLYELLVGRPPFQGENDLAIVRQLLADEPVAPRRIRPEVPRDLETVCLKCLEKRPQDRYATAAALAQDLGNFLECKPTSARPLPLTQVAVKWARRRPAVAALIGTIALALAGLVGGTAWYAVETDQRNAALTRINDELKKTAQREHDERTRAEQREHELRLSTYADRFDRALDAYRENRAAQAVELLSELIPEPGEKDLRGFEWHYLKGLCHPLHSVLRGHLSMVRCVAVSPDGKTLASSNTEKNVRLWDVATGRLRAILPGPNAGPKSMLFSPDGRTLAVLCDATRDAEVMLWDVPTAELRARRTLAPGQAATSLAQHPNGAFSPDSKTLAVVTLEGGIGLWDVLTGNLRMQYRFDDRDLQPFGIAFAPDGKTLAIGNRGWTVALWDITTGMERSRWEGHAQWVKSLAFSVDGTTLASGSLDRTVRLWDVAAAKCRAVLNARYFVHQVAFSPDGRMVAAAASTDDEGELLVWDAETGRALATYDHLVGEVASLAFIPHTRLLAVGSADRTVKILDLGPAPAARQLAGHMPDETWALAFSPDGKLLASGGDDHQIRITTLATGEQRALPAAHESLVTAVGFSKDGRLLASASFDGAVKLWDGSTLAPIRTLSAAEGERLRCLALAPDGSVVAAGTQTKTTAVVRLWDARTGQELPPLAGHAKSVRCVAFSPDGATLVSGSEDGLMRWWDAKSWRLLAEDAGGDQVSALAFAPDGTTLFAASLAGDISLWDCGSRARKQVLRGHDGEVFALTCTPDGRTLCSAGQDKTVRLWQAATGRQLAVLDGHNTRVNAVAFSPDGRTLASAGHDGIIKLWASAAGAVADTDAPPAATWRYGWGTNGCVETPVSHGAFATDVVIQPDGKVVAGLDFIALDASNLAMLRFHPSGIADASFGVGGTAAAQFAANKHTGAHLALLPDGKMLLGGAFYTTQRGWDFLLARFTPAGALDRGFGAQGFAVTDFYGSRDVPFSTVVQPDGKVVLAGNIRLRSGQVAGGIARYLPQGSPDQDFGDGGKTFVSFRDGAHFVPGGIALQSDGKLLMTGCCENGLVIARLRPDGRGYDESFGNQGKMLVPPQPGFTAQWSWIGLQPDGRIVTLLRSVMGNTEKCTLARRLPNGHQDSTFGEAGSVALEKVLGWLTSDPLITRDAMTIQSDGSIVVAIVQDHATRFALLRLSPEGRFDPSFGDQGRVLTEFKGKGTIHRLAMQPDGKIVAAGCVERDHQPPVVSIYRFHGDGRPDGFGEVRAPGRLNE